MTDPQQPVSPPTYNAPPVAPAAYGAPVENPGKVLGIVALISVFFISLLGLILGFVANSQSKKVGLKNGPAKAAIILGFIFIALTIIGIIIAVVLTGMAAGQVAEFCTQNGPGTFTTTSGVTVTCGSN